LITVLYRFSRLKINLALRSPSWLNSGAIFLFRAATDGGKDVTVTTDDFLREQMESSQRQRTQRRRDGRSRRQQVYWLGGVALLVLMILGAPMLISHTSIGRSMLASHFAEYDLEATASSVHVGWITPLRVTGLQVRGPSGSSELNLERLDTELTVTDLIGSMRADWGEIALRGVNLSCAMEEGRCSLEQDLAPLWAGSDDTMTTTVAVKLQDVTVTVADHVSGGQWQIAQSSGDVTFRSDQTEATFAGVVSDPSGGGGSLQGELRLGQDQWEIDLQSESLPLSVVTLVRRRFPELADTIPSQVGGDATGSLRIAGLPNGVIEASLSGVQVRNLTAAESQSRLWTNQLATVDGELVLTPDRVIGRQLRATTDFASATINGAFSRSVSLVGASDNPLRWLEGLDGSATAEIDLPALDRALPGLLPLKQDAQLVSGRAVAELNSLPASGSQRRSQLIVRSEQVRARASGRAVVIDPILLKAVVATDQNHLTAEEFQWTSAFASAVGQGDLRSGRANVEIDFGRLSSTLRPIVDLARTSLDGTAEGNISWNASADDVWRLSGSGNATNLVITLPGGKVFRRPSIQSDIEAVGRWGGKSLEELSEASVTFVGSGLDLRAELIEPAQQPSPTTPLAVKIHGNGRIETLAETLSPWLPTELHDAEGGFTLNARGEVSSMQQRIRVAAIELTMPRVAYGDRYFSQPNVKIHFDGDFSLPSGKFSSQSLTVLSDAFSAAVRGVAAGEQLDLHVSWKANLERLQGSVRKQIARRPEPAVRQVGYRSGDVVNTEDWLVMGDCEGELGILSRDNRLRFDTLITAKNVAVVQPPKASQGFQIVGPMPQRAGQGQLRGRDRAARIVWSEPNLRVDGSLNVDRTTGHMSSDSINVAGDWFATDLGGQLNWNANQGELSLRGPARLKMEQVAQLLTKLAGTEIRAAGIQETPLSVQAVRGPDGHLHFTVAGNLGWESAEVAGIVLGEASVPVKWTETSVSVSPSVIPVGDGQLNLAGDVTYRPGPLWLRVRPGTVAKSVRLTPEITDRWLKYLAPLVADATRVDGAFSAELDEAIVVFDQPNLSRVVGRLNIEGAQMTAGPLANQIIGGIEQLKAIARVSGGSPAVPNRTLINMPPQSIEFMLDSGVVTHKRLFLEIDRASVVTSGRVALDGRLDMVAQVPLDARWLGSDLQGLAGQPVTLPIDGTLSRPSLDSSGVRQVASQLGVQAVQSTAENYLQQQLNRGIERIFGGN
jgi:translocation and assembly module TamB